MQKLPTITEREIQSFLKKYPKIEFINCIIVDMLGLVRGKQIHVSKIKNLTKPHIPLPKSILLQNSKGENFDIPSIHPTDPDYFAHGIAGTLYPALWSSKYHGISPPSPKSKNRSAHKNKTLQYWDIPLRADEIKKAHVLLNLLDDHEQPFIYNGRELVQQMAQLIKQEFNYKVTLAIELEFYLFAQTNKKDKPQSKSQHQRDDYTLLEPANHLFHYPYFTRENGNCYGIDGVESLSPFTDQLIDCLHLQDIEVEGISSEYGSGQFEVNLKYQHDPILACDQAILLKHTLKSLAKQFGIFATFMAVPNTNSPNGMHINVSLQDEKGNNVFYQKSNSKKDAKQNHHISEVAFQCIGGMEKTAEDAMLVFAPNFNSYKRYYSQGYSPGNITSWGVNNRTVAIRIPVFNEKDSNAPKSMRIEHRLAGADSNVYLATAAVLAGMYWGLKNQLQPSVIEEDNAYRIPLWKSELPSMSYSLSCWKKKNNLFRSLWGKKFCDTFYQQRITEWNHYVRSLTQIDFDWYSHY